MDIKNFTDNELKEIHNLCSVDNFNNLTEEQRDYLLNVYESLFDHKMGYLHYWMAKEVLKAAEKEMISRFVNS